jgi:hypothetical protein
MNFYRVAHRKPEDEDDDEPRVAAVVAERAYSAEGYERFEVWDSIEGLAFPGPARIMGLEGAPAFSWK